MGAIDHKNHAAVAATISLARLICYRWYRHGFDGLMISDTGRCVPVRGAELPASTPFYPLTVRKATVLIARSIDAGHDYIAASAQRSAA